MLLATSYFYHIRFFKPWMVPLSTAVWDPKWYHKDADYSQRTVFLDNNSVINGLRILPLVPDKTCQDLCRGFAKCATQNPVACEFLRNYGNQLRSINFEDFIKNLETSEQRLQKLYHINHEILFVFMVYEATDKQCSERVELLKWFANNNYTVNELKYPIIENY